MSSNITLKNLIDDDVCPLKSGSKLAFHWEPKKTGEYHRYIGTLDDNGNIHCTIKGLNKTFKSLSTFAEYCLEIVSTRTSSNGWREVRHGVLAVSLCPRLEEYRSEYDKRLKKPIEEEEEEKDDDYECDSKVTQEDYDKWRNEGGYKWKKSGYRLFKEDNEKCKLKEYTTNRLNKITKFRWIDEWIQHEAEKGSQGHQGTIGYKNKPSNKDGFIILRRVYERPIPQVSWREV